MANDIYNDHPVAVDATRALIKKIKKADAENAAALVAHNQSATAHADIRQEIEDVNVKGLVVLNGQLRFM